MGFAGLRLWLLGSVALLCFVLLLEISVAVRVAVDIFALNAQARCEVVASSCVVCSLRRFTLGVTTWTDIVCKRTAPQHSNV